MTMSITIFNSFLRALILTNNSKYIPLLLLLLLRELRLRLRLLLCAEPLRLRRDPLRLRREPLRLRLRFDTLLPLRDLDSIDKQCSKLVVNFHWKVQKTL